MTVQISDETAEVALREIDTLVHETDPSGDIDDPMTPLARARKRIKEAKDGAVGGAGSIADGLSIARAQVDIVGDLTGAETRDIDPLQDDVFRARQELREVLD